ncbi:hypothetical protein [Stutzerimonas xanthomarina]|uniref:hypothetical protein n=1 Tax=Stutzerimonas xanthomarina TaxID=271420 RepID=UPI003AA7BE0D
MNDYYLQTADEESMTAALIAAGVTDADGNPTPCHAVSVIGTWHEQSDPEAEPVAVPGYHANVRSAEPIEWPESVTVHEPRTPWRVWG